MKPNWMLIGAAIVVVIAAFFLAVQQGANAARADAGLPAAPLTANWN